MKTTSFHIVIDLSTFQVIASIPVGQPMYCPAGMVFTPDGYDCYVTSETDNRVYVISAKEHIYKYAVQLISIVPNAALPRQEILLYGIGFSPITSENSVHLGVSTIPSEPNPAGTQLSCFIPGDVCFGSHNLWVETKGQTSNPLSFYVQSPTDATRTISQIVETVLKEFLAIYTKASKSAKPGENLLNKVIELLVGDKGNMSHLEKLDNGQIVAAMTRIEQAIKLLEQFEKMYQDHPELGKLMKRIEEVRGQLSDYARSLSLMLIDAAETKVGSSGDMEKIWRAEKWVQEGIEVGSSGDYKEATHDYKKSVATIVKLKPTDPVDSPTLTWVDKAGEFLPDYPALPAYIGLTQTITGSFKITNTGTAITIQSVSITHTTDYIIITEIELGGIRIKPTLDEKNNWLKSSFGSIPLGPNGVITGTVKITGVKVSQSVNDVRLPIKIHFTSEQTPEEGIDTEPCHEAKTTVVGIDLTEVGLDSVEANGEITLRKQGGDTWTNDKYKDDGDRNITDPIWQDTNWDDKAETNDSVCYLKGIKPKIINTKLKISPNIPSATPVKAKLRIESEPKDAAGNIEKVTYGSVDITLTGDSLTIDKMDGDKTVGSVINNFYYEMHWRVSFDNATSWQEFQVMTHTTFVIYSTPITSYCSSIGGWEPPYAWSDLKVTVRRMNWATKAGKGESLEDEICNKVNDYTEDHPGFSSADYYVNPFEQLDADGHRIDQDPTTKGDCISLANLAATALRLLGINAAPYRAYTRNKIVPNDLTTWGWDRKMHPFHTADWWLGYPRNNFEGFFYVGNFDITNNVFPTKAWTVAPRANIIVAQDKAKYMPIAVLHAIGVGELDWAPAPFPGNPDVEWKPGVSISGITLNPFGSSWSSDPVDDGEYNIVWNKTNSTLKLHDGPAVSITTEGEYALTCTKGSIKIKVTIADLPTTDRTGTARIVPARTLAPVP